MSDGRPALADSTPLRHSSEVSSPAQDLSPIPSAPFDDLDLERPEDEEQWERRVMAVATARIAAERARLEKLGIIDSAGNLVSHELPRTCALNPRRQSRPADRRCPARA